MTLDPLLDSVRSALEQSSAADFADYGQGREEHWVANAESALGFAFPPSYRWWLRMYGGGEVDGIEIYSVYDIEGFVGTGDVVRMHRACTRSGRLSADQLAICNVDGDELFYLALHQRDERGEAPVYVLDPINGTHAHYAATFADFLKRFVGERGRAK